MTTSANYIASLAIIHHDKQSLIHEVFSGTSYGGLIKKVISWFGDYAGTKFKVKTEEKEGFIEVTLSHESYEKAVVFKAKPTSHSIKEIVFHCLHNVSVKGIPLTESLREEGVLRRPDQFDIIEKVIKS